MMERDDDFYRRRLSEERLRAGSATDPVVISAHRALADLYAERIARIAPSSRQAIGALQGQLPN